MVQELITLPGHLNSPSVFSRVRVARYCFMCNLLQVVAFPFGYCVVRPSSIYSFWLPFGIFILFPTVMPFLDVWLLITSLVSLNLFPLFCLSLEIRLLIATLAASTFFPLCYLSVFALQVLITPLVSLNTRQIALPFLLRFTVSDYPFDIFNVSPLRCLSLFHLWLLITPLVSSNFWPLTGMEISDLRHNRYP